jgi:L-cysteine:1D-myo-inositol 2-amino-2-deoxy-alpha-D-glucopyranoside ligase
MHAGMVRLDGTKMSKSLGNLVFVHDLLKDWEGPAIRLAVLAHHYRHDWDWHDTLMPAATERLATWRQGGEGDGALAEVRAALDDDLDTAGAIDAIDRAAAAGLGVSEAAALLGVA